MSHSMYKISGTEATLISAECNPETSKGSENSADLYILNGKLYYQGTEKFSDMTFSAIGKCPDVFEVSTKGAKTYGISEGKLYLLPIGGISNSATQIGSEVDWTDVTGISFSYTDSGSGTKISRYAYGLMAGGKLFALNESNSIRVSDISTAIEGFTFVRGSSSFASSENMPAVALIDGKLYCVIENFAKQVGTAETWIASFSDFIGSNNCFYGISEGKLYRIDRAMGSSKYDVSYTPYQVGSLTGWTKLSGEKYPLGICDGKLYRIANNDVTQIGTETGWKHIGGYCSETGITGYGICSGKLYAIGYTSVTQIGEESDWMYLSESGTIAIRGSDGTGGGGNIPTDGLVFYAPLAESKATAETGQAFTSKNIVYTVDSGIPCVHLYGGNYLNFATTDIPSGKNPITISFFIKSISTATSGSDTSIIFIGGGTNTSFHFYWQPGNSIWILHNGGSGYDHSLYLPFVLPWTHIVYTYDGLTQNIYADGILINSFAGSINRECTQGKLSGSGTANALLAAFRIYNRVLSHDEILELSNEFSVVKVDKNGFSTKGLYLYAPLKVSQSVTSTGQFIGTSSPNTFQEYDGIQALVLTGSRIFQTRFPGFSGVDPSTFSFWFNSTTEQSNVPLLHIGTTNPSCMRRVSILSDGTIGWGWSGGEKSSGVTACNTGWHHVVLTYDGSTANLYVDNELKATNSLTLTTAMTGWIYFGGYGAARFTGYMAGARVYNRVISEEEISALYAEFDQTETPLITEEGLIFHAPFSEYSGLAETGQRITDAALSHKVYKDIPCAEFSEDNYIEVDDISFLSAISGNASSTQCFWMCSTTSAEGTSASDNIFLYQIVSGTETNDQRRTLVSLYDQVPNSVSFNFRGTSLNGTKNVYDGEWHFIAAVHNESDSLNSLYIDGELENTLTHGLAFSTPNTFIFGKNVVSGSTQFYGYLAGARLYNRALSENEIKSIYNNEFKSETEPTIQNEKGFIMNGIFFSTSKPNIGQKGILIDNKYFLPLVEGGGGSAEYYKCASVDTETHTWTGYKATLNDGFYSYEETLTEGLTYTSVVPLVGNIYSADALVTVEKLYLGSNYPQDGLVFYAPLDQSRELAETGQELLDSAGATFTVQDGIPCLEVKSDRSSYVELTDDSSLPFGLSPRTISIWGKTLEVSYVFFVMMGYGSNSKREGIALETRKTSVSPVVYVDFSDGQNLQANNVGSFYKWRHYLCTIEETGLVKLYVDGVFYSQKTDSAINTTKVQSIKARLGGSATVSNAQYSGGYVACCRIYNRVLSDEEIELLATELSPTTEETEETT